MVFLIINIKISLLKYIDSYDSYGIKKHMLSLKLVQNFPRCRGFPRGPPVFRRCLVFVALSPPPWGGNLRAAIRKDVQDTGKTTIDEQKCDDYGWFNIIQYDPTHSFHMCPQQLWCVMIYWLRASHGLSLAFSPSELSVWWRSYLRWLWGTTQATAGKRSARKHGGMVVKNHKKLPSGND